MGGQKLVTIKIEGYKSIKSQSIDLQDLNALIGQNGAGKSNFVSLFRLIRQIIEGGLQESVKKSSAETLLYYGSKTTQQITITLEFKSNVYRLTLTPDNADRLFISEEEVGIWDRKQYSSPYWNTIATNEDESKLSSSARVLLVPDFLLRAMQECRVYHFHDTSESAKVKKFGSVEDDIFLREDASNLAAFLYAMKESHSTYFEHIEKTIQLVIPFFKSFVLKPSSRNEDNIMLRWQDKFSDKIFTANEFSDGSIRFICLAVLLLQPHLPQVILLDEPELGLHPAALTILAGLLNKASLRTQVIICTQSVELVDQFEPENILVVDRQEGESVFTRLESEKLEHWLERYSLGDLWDKNVIGGRP